jgi:hypothetical protein
MSVYSNDLVTQDQEGKNKDFKRVPRGSNSLIGSDLNAITKDHRELRTSSATAGNTGTEYKLLSMTAGPPGPNNFNFTN